VRPWENITRRADNAGGRRGGRAETGSAVSLEISSVEIREPHG